MFSRVSSTLDRAVAPPGPEVRWHRPLIWFTGAMALLAVVAGVGTLVDDRTVMGSPTWFKPFKFALSFGLYSAALAWMLRLATRARRLGWWAGTVVAVASAAEVGVIVFQAARGRASHFNVGTPFDATIYDIMGRLAMVIFLGTLALAVFLAFQRHLDRAVAWAIRFGIGLSMVGMLVTMPMTSPTVEQQRLQESGVAVAVQGAHSVGVPDGGPSLPLTGWATTGGDLRIPHFVGLHALQLLPLLALLLVVFAERRPTSRLASATVRVRLVSIAAAGYAGTIALLMWQALRGQPLLRPDVLTLGAAAGLTVAVLLAVLGVLALGRGRTTEASHAGGNAVEEICRDRPARMAGGCNLRHVHRSMSSSGRGGVRD